ncbi:hypothetical protein [Aureimonas sp. AU4]|uniref:hypothetical protein n=1 Tax=Aureimonas sp. AU4 TaxID=1638163 RepID=UPI0012E372E0|nr:hypothetical protein [Aureimonas sp. AU4]
MLRTGPGHHRHRRGGQTVRALLRASLLAGPLAAALVLTLASAPGRQEDRPIALDAPDGLDATLTGSIVRPSVSYPAGGPLSLPNGGPCLRLPDGSQRGACR